MCFKPKMEAGRLFFTWKEWGGRREAMGDIFFTVPALKLCPLRKPLLCDPCDMMVP